MKQLETKVIAILTLLGLAVLSLPNLSVATDYSSTNFKVNNPVIDAGQKTSTSTSFGLGQSVSQTAIGKSTSDNFQLWSGFQYYFKVNANTLTAIAGDVQVSLSWTAPATFLGISVASYEVGVGTTSGSYTFTDRGSGTSYVQTGLTNGTPYFFKIKAKSTGGLFLVFSNEATATPVAPGGGGGSSGGGGGGAPPPPIPTGNASINLKGLASPGAAVFVLKDGAVAATTTADPTAGFNITLTGLATAVYSFTVYAEDIGGIRTSTNNFVESLTDGVASTVDNIFLAPSIGVDHSIIKQGDTLNIFGYTAPSSSVTVFTNSLQQYVNKVTAGNTGAWFQAFNTAVLDQGAHTTRSQSAKGNMLTAYSNTVGFQVGDKSVAITPGECKKSDFNCDGRVNLTDFSILLFNWNKTNPINAKADINKDGIVNLIDFSILLFDWTG